MRIIISENTVKLFENYQLAQKYYVKTGKISEEDMEYLKEYCRFPQYLSVYAWVYSQHPKDKELLKKTCDALNNYYNLQGLIKISELSNPNEIVKNDNRYYGILESISKRNELLIKLRSVDSKYLRNINKFLTGSFSLYGIVKLLEDLSALIKWIKTYEDYEDSEIKRKIINTAFSSQMESLEKIVNFLHDSYEEDLHHKDINSTQEVLDIIEEEGLQYDVKVLYNQGDEILLLIESQDALRELTCNSMYCFSRLDAIKQWNVYAAGEFVFLLFDFKYNYPDYLTVILPHLFAYSADNRLIGTEKDDEKGEKEAMKHGKNLLKKYLNKSDFNLYVKQAREYLEHYKMMINSRY